MNKRIYISYRAEDDAHRQAIEQWARRGQLGSVECLSEAAEHRTEDALSTKRFLSMHVNSADIVVLLVGEAAADTPWLSYEVEQSLSHRKPVIPVRVPGTSGPAPRALADAKVLPLRPLPLRSALTA